jgi:hypothetical protein
MSESEFHRVEWGSRDVDDLRTIFCVVAMYVSRISSIWARQRWER